MTVVTAAERRLERQVLLLVAMIQFINIWDFMMVMPLGPDFSKALGIDVSHLGWIAGSYSISAAIVGVVVSRFIDRFDRRSVIIFSLSGLTLSTLSMILATKLEHLLFLRVLTGAFGGPVIASSMAVIADIFPDHRRGEAVGKVFGSFSLAAVLGVPVSLEISHYFGWWAPFVAVSGFAALAILITRLYLPPMRKHIDERTEQQSNFSPVSALRTNITMRYAAVLMTFGTFAAFLLIPNISAYVQANMHYPRNWLGLLYFSGGAAAFFSMRIVGRHSDKLGYANTCLLGTGVLCLCVWLMFCAQYEGVPVPVYFILFMVGMSTRNVTSNALISKIPKPYERAGFMSLMSSIQHLMSGVGAACSAMLLTQSPDGVLNGMPQLAMLAMAAFIVMPWMMYKIEKRL